MLWYYTGRLTAGERSTYLAETPEYRDYVFDMNTHPEWTGHITRLRIEWLPDPESPLGEIHLDRVDIETDPIFDQSELNHPSVWWVR
jgi:hypothetical protein